MIHHLHIPIFLTSHVSSPEKNQQLILEQELRPLTRKATVAVDEFDQVPVRQCNHYVNKYDKSERCDLQIRGSEQ